MSVMKIISRLLIAIVVLVLILAVSLYVFLQTPIFGGKPTAEQIVGFASSPQYNPQIEEFQNRRPNLYNEMREGMSVTSMLAEWFAEREAGQPDEKLPEVKPNIEAFMAKSDEAKMIWFGHSTFLLNMSGTIILVDPIFSDYASPLALIGRRFQPPIIELEELPEVDVVLISHDHYDHLDMKSIRFFAGKSAMFVAPLGLSAHLRRWGVSDDKIVERDWWESYEHGGVELIAAPSQHFSGRDGIKNNSTLWASWVIKSEQSNLFFSGDSGFDTHFKTIGERYGPFDLALVEDGQYDKKWPVVHLFPEEAAQAAVDLRAKRAMPVHWGMFELAYHSWSDPIVRFAKALESTSVALFTPKIGEIVAISDDRENQKWWEKLLN